MSMKEAIMASAARIQEAVKRDDGLDWALDFQEKAKANALYRRIMKEYVLSDISGALGVIHDVAVEAAKRMAVGRDIIWVVPTTQPKVRFYLAKRGKVWRISEGPPLQTPERFNTVDISVDHEYGYDALFSQSYLEDVPFQVIQRSVGDAGQLLEEQITSDVTALYEAISAGDLAGGAEITADTAGTLAWADLVEAWTELKKAGYVADVAFIHPDQIMDLWSDDKRRGDLPVRRGSSTASTLVTWWTSHAESLDPHIWDSRSWRPICAPLQSVTSLTPPKRRRSS